MIRRQTAAGYLGSRCGCCWNGVQHQFFLVLLLAMSAEVNMCLYFIHSTVRSGSLAVAPLYQQFKLNMALYSTGAQAQGYSIFCQLCCGKGRWAEKKRCGYSTSLLLQELLEVFCHLLQATDRVFN